MTTFNITNYDELKLLDPQVGDIAIINGASYQAMSNVATAGCGTMQPVPVNEYWIIPYRKQTSFMPKIKGRGGKFKKYNLA